MNSSEINIQIDTNSTSAENNAHAYALRAKKSADIAQSSAVHTPQLGNNGNWHIWNASKMSYEDTGIHFGDTVHKEDGFLYDLSKLDIAMGFPSNGEAGNESTAEISEHTKLDKTVAVHYSTHFTQSQTGYIRSNLMIEEEIFENACRGNIITVQIYSNRDITLSLGYGFGSSFTSTYCKADVVHLNKGYNEYLVDCSDENLNTLEHYQGANIFYIHWAIGALWGAPMVESNSYTLDFSVCCNLGEGEKQLVLADAVPHVSYANRSNRSKYAEVSNHALFADAVHFAHNSQQAENAKSVGAVNSILEVTSSGNWDDITFNETTCAVTLVVNDANTSRTDTGFSVLLGNHADLEGKTLILKFEEKLPLKNITLNAGSAWGGTTYCDVQTLFTPYAGKYKIAEFNTLFNYLKENRSAVPDTFDGDMYMMVYNCYSWDLESIPVGETWTNTYQIYTTDDSGFVYSKEFIENTEKVNILENTVERLNEAVANLEETTINHDDPNYPKNAGIINSIVSIGAQWRCPEITLNNGLVTFPITSQTIIAGDGGFSVKIGNRSTLEGGHLIFHLDETLPFRSIAINAGSAWGNSTYVEIKPELTQIQGDYHMIDFADILPLFEGKDTVPADFDGDYYIMFYRNNEWILPAEGTLYNRYRVFLSPSDSLVYSKETGTLLEKMNTLTIAVDDVQNAVDSVAVGGGNVLWGKKYIACGDSFTQGDFSGWTDENGLSGRNSPVIFDSAWNTYKTYPWWIAKRNNMTLVNEALCGSIMPLSKQYVAGEKGTSISYRNPFSYERYKKIPLDADYITFWFGINDSSNTNLGTINDSDNTTFYGAWNVVIEYLITNLPYAKLGIIITNGAATTYRQATREIAQRWGIPYLDMMGDIQIPVIFGRESELGLCSKANSLRRSSFLVAPTNGHPNLEAHKYQSTFIEAFLRRL